MTRPLVIAVMCLGLSAAAASTQESQPGFKQIMSGYKFSNPNALQKELLVVFDAMPAGMTCGSAMTQKACKSVRKHLRPAVANDWQGYQDLLYRVVVKRNGENVNRSIRAAENSGSVAQSCDRGDRCKYLLDAMFPHAAKHLEAARKKAAREVGKFYKDGRPFKG